MFLDFFRNFFSKEEDSMIPKNPGLIESPLDYRDIPLEKIQELKGTSIEIPEEYNVPYRFPITRQDGPHCVGHSARVIKEEKEKREQNYDVQFDPVWLYNECKKIDGRPDLKGTYFRSVFKVLQKKGAKPINGNDFAKYRIGGYASLKRITINDIKEAIYCNGVLLAGFKGSYNGWSNSLKGHIRPPRAGESTWGHATALIGYNGDYIIGQNSWGDSWGDGGYFYFNENYFPFSVWSILVDLPNNWRELIGLPTKPSFQFNQNLYFGLKGTDVVELQDALKWEGCFPTDVPSTGYFGNITLESVKRFQEKYNIEPVLGYVGPLTRSKLNQLF